jgi:hypothetical protein
MRAGVRYLIRNRSIRGLVVVQAAVNWIDSLTVDVSAFNISNTNDALRVFPNPVRGQASVTVTSDGSQDISVFICNAFGAPIDRIVYQENVNKGDHSFSVNTEHLRPGIYFIILESKTGIETKQMVVLN